MLKLSYNLDGYLYSDIYRYELRYLGGYSTFEPKWCHHSTLLLSNGWKKKNSSSLICGQFGHYSGLKVMIKFEVQSCAGNIPFLEAWAVRVFFYSNMVFFLFKKTNKKIIIFFYYFSQRIYAPLAQHGVKSLFQS